MAWHLTWEARAAPPGTPLCNRLSGLNQKMVDQEYCKVQELLAHTCPAPTAIDILEGTMQSRQKDSQVSSRHRNAITMATISCHLYRRKFKKK